MNQLKYCSVQVIIAKHLLSPHEKVQIAGNHRGVKVLGLESRTWVRILSWQVTRIEDEP